MSNIVGWVVIACLLMWAFFGLRSFGSSLTRKGAAPITRNGVRIGQAVVVLLLALHAASTSFFYVGQLETEHIVKRFMGGEMPQGNIIARNGENGPQVKIYGPGLHFSPLISLYNDIIVLPAAHYTT